MALFESLVHLFEWNPNPREAEPLTGPVGGEKEIVQRVEDECKGEKGYNVHKKATYFKEAVSFLGSHFGSSRQFDISHPDLRKYTNLIQSIVKSKALFFQVTRQVSIVEAIINAGDGEDLKTTSTSMFQTFKAKNLNDKFIRSLGRLSKDELETVRSEHRERLNNFAGLCEELINYYYGHVSLSLALKDSKQVIVKPYNGKKALWKHFYAHYFGDGKDVGVDSDTSRNLREIDDFDASAVWSKQITFCSTVVVRDSQTQIFVKSVAEARAYILLGKCLLADMFAQIVFIPNIPSEVVDGIILKLPWKDREAAEKWANDNQGALSDIMVFLKHKPFVWNMEAKAGKK